MKPLELTVYPKPQNRNHVTGGWFWDCEACNTITHGPSKRLTNAELAAEYWCSEWRTDAPETSTEVKAESARRAIILHRFSTLPHYDEVPE